MTEGQGRLDFEADDPLERRDADARTLAVDPRRNVALEASAGTGKTRVLVDRYVGLLAEGVKPRNILAITFTRKAAAEMRQRILQEVARRRRERSISEELWRGIRESVTDISISTIDAFCLALLREFPLEADVDPGFDLADETETPRLVDEALERTLRIARGLATEQAEMALLFAQLGEYQLRQGLARLIDRRLVAWNALSRFVRGAEDTTIDAAVARLLTRLREAFASVPGGMGAVFATAPDHPDFPLLARDLRRLLASPAPSPASTQALLERVRDHFLTGEGEPRKRLARYKKADFRSPRDYEKHVALVQALGPYLVDALTQYRHDINMVLSRAVRQLFAIALREYEHTLRKHGVLDFSDVLHRTLTLLGQMEEFSRSRFKLEARYQHVLVDEFQDTSRAQWELVELLVTSWASGLGMAERDLAPSIFIVGDRKQSIYGFRDAEVAVLDEAARYIEALRPVGQVRTAITRSFRSVREVLHFVNDVFAAVDKVPDRADAFRYSEDDTFPLASVAISDSDALNVVAGRSDEEQAEAVAEEIARLLIERATVRDRDTGVRRHVRPGDICVLFRTREGHRLFEGALGRRRIPYYVYKGLGFFEADEIKDVLALLSFLARPESELHAAALLRSRFIRLSDEALKHLAPDLAGSLRSELPPEGLGLLHADDQRRLTAARQTVPGWLALVDRLPPSELLDRVLSESAYSAELAGPAYRQARENLKKVRGLVRRIQNRGYATLGRIVDHFAQLVAGGDESNAIIDAVDAVNLMTAHAAKGLEYPIVFVVNMHRGSGGSPDPIRIVPAPFGRVEPIEPSVSIGEHQGEGDRDLEAREAEEGKRLLYVALTRARDRLYLCATVERDGRFVAGRGGFGRTLPASLGILFTAAYLGEEPQVTWQGASGTHRLAVVRLGGEEPRALGDERPTAGELLDDFTALPADGLPRVAATAASVAAGRGPSATTWPVSARSPSPLRPARTSPPGSMPEWGGAPGTAADRGRHTTSPSENAVSSLDVGVLVHRALDAGTDDLASLLRDEERALIDDVPSLIRRASVALADLRAHPEIAAVFGDDAPIAWRRHEVPFSWRPGDGTIVRGTFDCLLQRLDGVIQVIEFKTGSPDVTHQQQLAVYMDAARALFPGHSVEGRLIYPGESGATFRESGRLT